MHDSHRFIQKNLDFNSVKKASLILRILNNKVCKKILTLLAKNNQLTVTDLFTKLEMEQSVVSMHLAKMRSQRMVTTERNGKSIYYCLNLERLEKLNKLLISLNDEQSK